VRARLLLELRKLLSSPERRPVRYLLIITVLSVMYVAGLSELGPYMGWIAGVLIP
jgi:hypothetical protein